MPNVAPDDEIALGGNGALQNPVIRRVSRDDFQRLRRGNEMRVADDIILHLPQFLRIPLELIAQDS